MLHLDAADHLARQQLERIEVADGLRPARGSHFEPGACIARMPWRMLTDRRRLALGVHMGCGERHDTVALMTVPDALLEAVVAWQRDACTGHEEARKTAALTGLSSWLQAATRWRLDPANERGCGFLRGRATWRASTRESSTGRLVGLHIDSFDRVATQDRVRSQNRLCINLGPQERGFQFVPLLACELESRVCPRCQGQAHAALHPAGSVGFVRRYLACPHGTTVLRIRLRPGQAYIAPTENLIHDGCVFGRAPDSTFTFRGVVVPVHA